MSEQGRFFIALPWGLYDVWTADRRVNRTHVLVAFYVAARCFEARNTSAGVAPIELRTVARLCDVRPETIRRRLHDLREWGWVDFRGGDGGDPAWQIWLTGLSIEAPSPRPLHDLSTQNPVERWRGLSTDSSAPSSANRHGKRESAAPTSPQSDESVPDRRDETRPEKNYVRGEREASASRESSERLSDEEITEIGFAPLGELLRRYAGEDGGEAES